MDFATHAPWERTEEGMPKHLIGVGDAVVPMNTVLEWGWSDSRNEWIPSGALSTMEIMDLDLKGNLWRAAKPRNIFRT